MTPQVSIVAAWEALERGSDAERACFAALGIRVGDAWLTEAEDAFVKRVRQQVHLSAYRLAEWLAWNYWRLCWESADAQRPGWALAHRLSTIGVGYVWPNLTLQSDGERVAFVARPTAPRASEPLRYLASTVVGVPRAAFEGAVDLFIDQVRGQLRAEGVARTNLDDLWDDVRAERLDPVVQRQRRWEAMLGFDPDEAPACALQQLDADARAVGEAAMAELAAAAPGGSPAAPRVDALWELAATSGVELRATSGVRLDDASALVPSDDVPAWVRGSAAARALRAQERLGHDPLDDARLADMAGIDGRILAAPGRGAFSFELRDDTGGRVVLRQTPWKANRRFDLARLLGDRLAHGARDTLLPATKSFTYRQKWQRAFAAELLCPVDGLDAALGGDLSDEAIDAAAAHFGVSALAARMVLVNDGRLERGDGVGAA